MKEAFEKKESLFSILIIVAYVVINSYFKGNYGIEDLRTVIADTVMSVLLIILIVKLGRVEFYGIRRVENKKQFLYFIPLALIAFAQLINGININNTASEIVYHILTMINVGFLEEAIFRGFLFKMMEKDNLKSAIIVSSLTFGIGHIVNLLSGGEFIPTLIQICYAVALGYLFVIIFYYSKSLIPCICAHITINSLSIFNVDNNISSYGLPVIWIVLSIAYAIYIQKTVKAPTKA